MAAQTRKSFLKFFLAAFVIAPLAGACAFSPLYGPTAGGSSVSRELAAVQFNTVPGRVGQKLRNELIFAAYGGGSGKPAKYNLEIAIRESVLSTLVERTGNASGNVYSLQADFTLVRLADKAIVFKGFSQSRASFDKYSSSFANTRARIDAENRAAKVVANDVKTRLAAYLSGAV